jgi:hypothetical protein
MRESISRNRALVGRRRLLQLLGLAGTAPGWFLASRLGFAAQQENAPTEQTEQKPESEAAPPEEPEISEQARELGEMARRRYGEYLDEEQFEGLVEDMNRDVLGGQRMRKVVLTNADEPDFVFRAEP